MFLNSI
jgi:WD40 repeat-containing protein SMU1